MRFKAVIGAILYMGIAAIAWGQPQGKWGYLDRDPSCKMAFDFKPNGVVVLPDIRSPQKQVVANWRMQNKTIIITDRQKKWESYYSYQGNEIIWQSIKTLGKTQNITNQYALSDRSLKPCS